MSDRQCPRDRALLHHATINEVTLDVCGKCQGTFFDSGEMLGAFGQAADPAAWDRAETGGTVKPSDLPCPRCTTKMHAQDVAHDGKDVEIDRCGKCRGVWLDKDEIDTIIAIGHAMQPLLEAERKKAKEEVEKLGDVSFAQKTNWKLVAGVVVGIAVLAGGIYFLTRPEPRVRAPERYEPGTRAKGEEGCPCGCDHSSAMAASLRAKSVVEAGREIEKTLATIAARENAGYITERMVQHRLRMRALATDLRVQIAEPPVRRPRGREELTSIESDGLRVSADLVVHGERIEIVLGEQKLITPSFRLLLSIENLEDRARVLTPPSLSASGVHMPVSRWYVEGTDGEPWSGALPAKGVVRVLAIGDIPEHLRPDDSVSATVSLAGVTFDSKAQARGTIVFAN